MSALLSPFTRPPLTLEATMRTEGIPSLARYVPSRVSSHVLRKRLQSEPVRNWFRVLSKARNQGNLGPFLIATITESFYTTGPTAIDDNGKFAGRSKGITKPDAGVRKRLPGRSETIHHLGFSSAPISHVLCVGKARKRGGSTGLPGVIGQHAVGWPEPTADMGHLRDGEPTPVPTR